jgi:transcriptional regulator with XRE-family HTH domain
MPKRLAMQPDQQSALALRIRLARKSRGYRQDELGELIGYVAGDLGTGHHCCGRVSELERGRHPPTVSVLIRLCEILDVSADWLLFGRGKGPTLNEKE